MDTTGKNVKKGGYVKKNVSAYNLKLEKVTEVENGNSKSWFVSLEIEEIV